MRTVHTLKHKKPPTTLAGKMLERAMVKEGFSKQPHTFF
jgi:hypothetical protein